MAKGLALALELARLCPDIPFLFARNWPLSGREEAELKQNLKALPNVTLLQRSSNMSEIYAKTRILLVPSQWEETWGRVVSEAQISGIPVLATKVGALPESVGPGASSSTGRLLRLSGLGNCGAFGPIMICTRARVKRRLSTRRVQIWKSNSRFPNCSRSLIGSQDDPRHLLARPHAALPISAEVPTP
ncbi:glycosyltransferase [Aliirhizobium terrae]|uniref:glycosyltransferase n=1 Tax=Terrirhizobium terrae TaxID=2926709 RepID=UPI00336A25AD